LAAQRAAYDQAVYDYQLALALDEWYSQA